MRFNIFLVYINYIKQQVARCQFYLNESVRHQRAPRVSTRLIQADNLQRKSFCRPYSRKYFNTTSVTTIIFKYRQLVKRVFNVSAILIHNTLQTTSPLSDAVINEARSPASTDQRCRTSCCGRLAPQFKCGLLGCLLYTSPSPRD